MSRYPPSGAGRRPPGPWHSIHPGIRAAIISFAVLAFVFVGNALAAGVFAYTGWSTALVCYPIQLLAYIANGLLGGWQADETRRALVPTVGPPGARVRRNVPNYIAIGAIAGLVLAVLAALVYFLTTSLAVELIPGLALFGFATPWAFVVVDGVLSIGLGALGGIIWDRLFSMPGRRPG